MPSRYSGTPPRERSPATRTTRSSTRLRRARRKRAIALLILVASALMVGADLVRRGVSLGSPAHPAAASPIPATGAATTSPSAPSITAAPVASPTPELTAAGPFPTAGPGTWTYSPTQGPVLGTAGTLRRFRVAVETGISQDMAAFAAKVDETLGDPRGWTASRQLRLQRVPGNGTAEFTIYLATPETARRLCSAGGVDILKNGVPYASCRTIGKMILNLARWMSSVPGYVDNRIPLAEYRTYMINHEAGHQVGYNHELCPGPGKPAPVMQTQTLDLQGCTANPWPYLDGKRYVGPPAPR